MGQGHRSSKLTKAERAYNALSGVLSACGPVYPLILRTRRGCYYPWVFLETLRFADER